MRKNSKSIVLNTETAIKKSNELSLAKLNNGLSLNQMQLLSFAIFSTQKKGATTFNKAAFEKQFELTRYATKDAQNDSERLLDLKVAVDDIQENDSFEFYNVFTRMKYKKGTFTFVWNDEFLPHILDLKERYIINDLTVAAKFKSSFTWVLYEHLKALYGYWHKKFTKEALMKLFSVENVASYQKNTGIFKVKVLDLAIQEINEYTEMNVHYVEIKDGRTITGFELHWSFGKVELTASKALIEQIKSLMVAVENEVTTLIKIKDEAARLKAIAVYNFIDDKFNTLNDSTSQTEAQNIYDYIRLRTIELNQILVESDTKKANVSFYNWLDERE